MPLMSVCKKFHNIIHQIYEDLWRKIIKFNTVLDRLEIMIFIVSSFQDLWRNIHTIPLRWCSSTQQKKRQKIRHNENLPNKFLHSKLNIKFKVLSLILHASCPRRSHRRTVQVWFESPFRRLSGQPSPTGRRHQVHCSW